MVSRPFILFYVSATFSLLIFSCSSKTSGSSGQSLNPLSLIPPLLYPFTAVLLDTIVSHSYLIFATSTSLQFAIMRYPSLQLQWTSSLPRHFFVLPDVSVVSNPADHCLLPTLLLCSCLCYSLCWLPVFLWLIFLRPSQY